MPLSFGSPSGLSKSSCGYCSSSGERSPGKTAHYTASLDALQLSCEVYQKMIDRGWRRAGSYCYKPMMKTTCCPQYTIKLDALEFKTSKSHRKLLSRFNRFITQQTTNAKGKAVKNEATVSLAEGLHSSENQNTGRNFEVTLEPSSYSKEKFELYRKYQVDIHDDSDNTPASFKRFLADSPLIPEPIPYTQPRPSHLPEHYGSFHQLYRVDGKLVALAVLDILPLCVSSVYFMYDKEWEKFSLGKLSVLRECSLAREIHECGVPSIDSLYLGFYVHSCPKMKYKGEYTPSFLCDPETYVWYPMATCTPLLDVNRYAVFSDPERSIPPSAAINDDEFAEQDPPDIDESWLKSTRLITEVRNGTAFVQPVTESDYWQMEATREEMLWCIHGLGRELSSEILFTYILR